jgi:hypothetical protein
MGLLLLCAIAVIVLGRSAAAEENDKLFGVWKLVSLNYEDAQTGEKKAAFRKAPEGYLILLPRRAHVSDRDRGSSWRSGSGRG